MGFTLEQLPYVCHYGLLNVHVVFLEMRPAEVKAESALERSKMVLIAIAFRLVRC